MARDEMPDQETEQRLRDHFAEEANELQAPEDLWDRLEGRLGKQQPPRFAFLRGGTAAIGGKPWIPAAAAAVLVVGVGLGAWALTAGGGDSGGGDDDDAPVAAASSRGRVERVEAAAATEAAYAAATEAAAPTRTVRATEEEAATETPAATQVAVTGTPAATQAAVTGTPAATQAAVTGTPAATQVAVTETPAATQAAEAEPPPAEEATEAPADPADDMDGNMDDMDEMADDMSADMSDETDDMASGDMVTRDDAMMEEDSGHPPAASSTGGPAEPSAEETPQQVQQPADTTFQDYERTAFVETSTDAVSTFSLDTDRTSYYLALTWVSNGYAVDPDSVRAEEWINAFDYGYAGPGDTSSFAITSDLARHPLDDDWHLARVALQAPDVRDDRPLNVTLVLDASGSMSWGDRVAVAREAAETIRQSLSDRDRIAVVHFTTDVLDRYTVEHSSPDDEDVVWSIERLAAHDSTNVQAGLNLGVQLAGAARRERPDAYNYIILMSDGVANVDATDPFAILESAPDSDSGNPLRLITIGVGIDNYNDVLLEQLAQHGNGWYRYLDTTAQARETFSRENWLALSTPFADQARAQVTWDPAVVKAWRIVGYENRITPDHTFVQNRREFADLPAGTATTVFYELELQEDVAASALLGSIEVRWVDPASGASRSQTAQVAGRTATSFDGADRHLRLGAIVGLAGDRYSSLSPQVENAVVDYAGIHEDLLVLRGQLDALGGSLGSTQAYQDFGVLLEWLTGHAAKLAPSSGYSR